MKTIFLPLCVALALASVTSNAIAVMDETEARDTVVSMLDQSQPATEIIAALMADGRDLIDATIFALVSGGENNRTAFAEAGIASATSLAQAQSVSYALIATAGATGPVADTVETAMKTYSNRLTPPSTYQGSGIATGGGSVSPSN